MRPRYLLPLVAGLLAVAAPAVSGRAAKGRADDAAKPIWPVQKKPEDQRRTARAPAQRAAIKLPFLGEIQVVTREKTRFVRTEAGGRMPLKFQVLTTKSGDFVQARFFKDGAIDYANSVEEVEAGMKASDQEIVGLVDDPKVVSWERVLAAVAADYPLDDVTQLSITLVRYRFFENGPKLTYLVHVFGTTQTLGIHDYLFTEAYKRVRYVANARGEILRLDNLL